MSTLLPCRWSAFLALFLSIVSVVSTQEEERLNSLLSQGRRDEALRLMKEWERNKPTDAQMFINWANYYFNKDAQWGIVPMDRPNPDGPTMTITKPGAPTEIVGYMWERVSRVRANVMKAVEYLDRALVHHPRRLDILFGRVYLWQELGDYRAMADAYIQALQTAHRYGFDLLWGQQGQVPDGDVREFFFNSAMDYYMVWMSTLDPVGMDLLREAAEVQTQLFPDHVFGWNLLAKAAMRKEQYQEALEILERGLSHFPDDVILRSNFAFCLWQSGALEEAKKQYESLLGKPGLDQGQLRNDIRSLEGALRQRDTP